MNDKTRDRIAFWIGMAGGGVFFYLNQTTKGEVPGGAQGGLLGMFVFGGSAWVILRIIQYIQKK